MGFSLRFAESSVCSTELTTKPWVLLSSFEIAEGKSILIGFSFGLGPSDVRYSLAQESNYERILALGS